MTQSQSIKLNIEYTELMLSRALAVSPKDELEKLHINSTIKYYKKQLVKMSYCLSRAI